jgi:hypothetical protein
MADIHEDKGAHGHPAISRRNILILGGVAIVAGALPAIFPTLEPDRDGLTNALIGLLADRASASHGHVPREPDAIAASIGKRLAPLGWQLNGTPEDLRNALSQRITEDFAKNDMIGIGGWQMARTAAELCALAASLEDEHEEKPAAEAHG